MSINASPWYSENAPGLLRMIGAIIFPLGLVMIVLTGADLFTGTNMARQHHKFKPWNTGLPELLLIVILYSTQLWRRWTGGYRSGRCCYIGSYAFGEIWPGRCSSWRLFLDVSICIGMLHFDVHSMLTCMSQMVACSTQSPSAPLSRSLCTRSKLSQRFIRSSSRPSGATGLCVWRAFLECRVAIWLRK